MIISFDGNVFVGKTTIISNLSEKYGFNKIVEYSDVLSSVPERNKYNNIYKNNQLRYLDVDKLRALDVKDGINLLDRSFISLSAHVFACYYTGLVDMRSFFIKELKYYFSDNDIIIPDKFINLFCPYELVVQRYNLSAHVKKTDKDYIDKKYFDYINNFNFNWSKKIDSLVINTDEAVDYKRIVDFIYSKNEEVNNEKILKIIKELLDI